MQQDKPGSGLLSFTWVLDMQARATPTVTTNLEHMNCNCSAGDGPCRSNGLRKLGPPPLPLLRPLKTGKRCTRLAHGSAEPKARHPHNTLIDLQGSPELSIQVWLVGIEDSSLECNVEAGDSNYGTILRPRLRIRQPANEGFPEQAQLSAVKLRMVFVIERVRDTRKTSEAKVLDLLLLGLRASAATPTAFWPEVQHVEAGCIGICGAASGCGLHTRCLVFELLPSQPNYSRGT